MIATVTLVLCACGTTNHSSRRSAPLRAEKIGTLAKPSASEESRVQSRFRSRSTALFASVLDQLARHEFVAGVWHPGYVVWRTGTELGTVAALVSRAVSGGPDRHWAIQTFDTALVDHQEPDGAFGPPVTGEGISTGAELVSLGTAFLVLRPVLDRAQRTRWVTALDRAGRWMVKSIYEYVNGNINLQRTLGLYLAWRATGDRALFAAYNRSWAFTLQPGPAWPGFGLIYTTTPTKRRGVGGAAYLAEKGAGSPGFDTHYTILQADYDAEMYAVSHAPRALRLLNLLVDQLLTRTNIHTLTIQTGGGSRHPTPNVSGPFVSASLPVLAFADRPDLLPLVRKQLSLAETDFRYYTRVNNDQDQIIGNYAMALLAVTNLGEPPSPVKCAKPESRAKAQCRRPRGHGHGTHKS